MGSIGQVRIAVWEGGCLWLGRTLQPFAGASHAHHAIQLSVLLDGTIGFVGDHAGSTARVTVIDADVPHRLTIDGRVAHLFIDPEGFAGRALRAGGLARGEIVALPDNSFAILGAELDALWHAGVAGDALSTAGAMLVAQHVDGGPRAALDPRIATLIATISARLDDPLDFATASASVALSPSRLRHLFADGVGMSFKRYVLWRRLMSAVEALGRGAPITQAAHGAGFADSAHFSRTFRRMFGLSANMLVQL